MIGVRGGAPAPEDGFCASMYGEYLRMSPATPPKRLAYNATLIRREDFTPKLAAFHVRYDEPLPGDPPFTPGQYVALGLNNNAHPELGSVRRAMSIASAPEQREHLEFYIRIVEQPTSDNPLTRLLWQMKEGERIFMTRKPTGKFTAGDTIGLDRERLLVCVAAGTGLAPFVSMVRSMRLRDPQADMTRILILHGASYSADLGYAEELSRYARDNGLRYFPTVSRPRKSPDWRGDTGRVEDFFLPERLADLEARAGLGQGALAPPTAGVLVCGLQGTIARCIERLAARGFVPFQRKIRAALDLPPEREPSLWWEQYDADPVIDIADARVVAALKRDLNAAERR